MHPAGQVVDVERRSARACAATSSVCPGSPLCEAHITASSRSPKPKRSSTPARTEAAAMNGFAALRR